MNDNQKILITGGTGAIGSVLVKRLIESGNSIRILTLPDDPCAKNFDNSNVEIRYGDISDKASITNICSGVSKVIHLAAIILTNNDQDYDRINIGGTRNMIEEAKKSNVSHFIHISSASVVYPKTTAYSLSKRVGERLIRESGIPFTIIRPTLVYGKVGGQEFDIFLNYLRRYAIIPFIGNGLAIKRPVYVEDIIDGLFAVASLPGGTGKVYNFSGGSAITIIDFARYCLVLMNSGNKLFFHLPVWSCMLAAALLKKFMENPPLRWNMIAGIMQDANLDPEESIRDLKFKASKITDMLPGCFPRVNVEDD